MTTQDRIAPKVGAGHASAMWRLGLSELRGAMYQQAGEPTPYGIYGTKLPSEIAQERAGDVQVPTSPDHEHGSILDSYVRDARDATRGPERDREDRDRKGRDDREVGGAE